MFLRCGLVLVASMQGCAGAPSRSDANAPLPPTAALGSSKPASPGEGDCSVSGAIESHELVPNVPMQFGNGMTVTTSEVQWDHFKDGSFSVWVSLQFRRGTEESTIAVDIRRAVCGETEGVPWRLADHVLSIPQAR